MGFGFCFNADSSFVPPLVYAMMGSSRDLAVGTVAVASLLIASMLGNEVNANENPKLYLHLAFTATFFAGVFQASLGLLRYVTSKILCRVLFSSFCITDTYYNKLMWNPSLFLGKGQKELKPRRFYLNSQWSNWQKRFRGTIFICTSIFLCLCWHPCLLLLCLTGWSFKSMNNAILFLKKKLDLQTMIDPLFLVWQSVNKDKHLKKNNTIYKIRRACFSFW